MADPSDVTRELAARLRELHTPVQERWADGSIRSSCSHCDTGDPYCTVSQDWPCPTMQIVDAAVTL